jgi:hypothetical protein
MSAQNVITASGAFGRATGAAALENSAAILAVYNKLENRTFHMEAAPQIAPGAHI